MVMSEEKKSRLAQLEETTLKLWEHEKTFDVSVANRENSEYFSFNDGPPFANGLPHFGHSLVTAIKDSMLRYKTMRGYYIPRRNGWDCHGLPVEYEVEKTLNISGKKQIAELGVDKFNTACHDSIFRYKGQWEEFLTRFGRWSDYENYYSTVDKNYTESTWWTLSQIHKKGLLYRGFQSLPYCPRCETPLSNFELNEGYRDEVPDPSIFVLFPLVDEPTTKLLAWTTTPWTLPANAALAVDEKADYAYVKLKADDSTLILAKERLELLDLRAGEYQVVKTVKGADLVGLRYQPLYGLEKLEKTVFVDGQETRVWQVFHDDSVSLEDGTGILHVAPRYGEADLALGLREKLPLIESVDSSGHMVQPKLVAGQFFKKADEHIIADLTRVGRVFAAETANHTYPFCWRCDSPLMYFATSTWFVAVSKIKDQLLKTAEDINWMPAHIKQGRFGKWLEGARDWAISRNRYWGAPMPIWVNTEDPKDYLVIGSLEELKSLAGDGFNLEDLHRPHIDEVIIQKDGKVYKRVEEVLDCWFESGSMPAAQWHYPFENEELFEKSFPADFVTEGLDQTRLWFYVQHVIATIVFDKPAFRNVIVNGMIMAADGQKLSKRLRNYPSTVEVFDVEGADAWRLYLLSSVQATETANYMRFERGAITDISRNILGRLENSFKFFKLYADIDGWKPTSLSQKASSNVLDQWVLSRLNETIRLATKNAEAFKIAHSITPVFVLIDDLSNWYVRRSRRRFWRPVRRSLHDLRSLGEIGGEGGKSDNDDDKQAAYATLWYVLMRISQLLAPWAPFISDRLWRELKNGLGNSIPDSVHLSDWPKVEQVDIELVEQMNQIRELISEGLSQRAEAKIKVRQPLAKVSLSVNWKHMQPELQHIIAEELNVKEVKLELTADDSKTGNTVRLDTTITAELKQEGTARELVRNIQNARKNAGLKVEDRIKLRIESDSPEITEVVVKFNDIIYAETLANSKLVPDEIAHYSEAIKIESHEVIIFLSKL